jgi:DNA repair protein RadC
MSTSRPGAFTCRAMTEMKRGDFPFRQIISEAAAHGTAGIVLAHNHPSGDPRPSDSDCRVTRRLASAAEALDCTIIDHLIFAGDQCTSFRRLGLL